MTLHDLLQFRRAVREYDTARTPDVETVRHCLELAQLAPTSSNMQLWECYHVTDKATLARLNTACLDQRPSQTAPQMVVFVVRPDLHRAHAQAALAFERDNIRRNSPADRQAARIARYEAYYNRLIPFLYGRCCGLLGGLRKLLAQTVGLFRPMVRSVSEADMRVVLHKSCGLAAQTFMLAMAEAGLDTCPLEGFDSLRVKRALRLPRAAEITMVVTCGYRVPEGVFGDRFRLPFEDIYHQR